ncbi:MAG: NACHT domain-containing protein [Clostridiales bacterium]|nr:NACHT domain-containing protein [Clostridiales bacterium]MBS5877797.1 NACHT domain-containing protein [Clostridiales bacterium]
MNFKDFIQGLASVLRAESNTAVFTRTIFETIIPEDRYDSLNKYSNSTFKAYYNGNAGIGRISRKINSFADPIIFSAFIDEHEDATVEKLCSVFKYALPDINTQNASDQIANLFSEIITDAAGANKKSAPKDAKKTEYNSFGAFANIAPELTAENAGSIFIVDPAITANLQNTDEEDEEITPFEKYLDAAITYYSTKKTLLYAEKPHPFYDLYVCNDVRYRKFRATGSRDPKAEKIINNVTIDGLEAESKYIIIQGIGGIGKSMLLTHLFLSSAEQIEETGRIPLLLSLKDYKDTTCGIVDFIWKSLREYDSEITQSIIITALQQKQLILLLDGLDEIQTSARDSFDQDLDAFIKSYPGNTIVITSRPVYSFVSYAKFSLFDILELSKNQAIELIEKLEFWDPEGKNSFLEALNRTLYRTHREFASNPLLLTIMLMTYSSFGEVPAKMHVFYSKAYETMARLHDASKGSFKRPLHTKLTPEEFAKYFSQFCARTYKDEILEFDALLFNAYMKKVLKGASPEHQNIAPRDFLLDLTDNLCIMYREGEHYYFIHRSFQEYFAAVYFASEYDANLSKVGSFFEKIKNRSYTDRTFDMLYDMIPEKIERFVFLTYLEELITHCMEKGDDEYWEFLEKMYPYLTYEEGNTDESYFNEAESFLYRCIIHEKHLEMISDIDNYEWPKQIYDLTTKIWVEAYNEFLEYSAFDKYPNPDSIPEHILDSTSIVSENDLPYKYTDYFGKPEQKGLTIEIDIYELRKNPHRYITLRHHMEDSGFPIFREYQSVKAYYDTLKKRTQLEIESDDLFDD